MLGLLHTASPRSRNQHELIHFTDNECGALTLLYNDNGDTSIPKDINISLWEELLVLKKEGKLMDRERIKVKIEKSLYKIYLTDNENKELKLWCKNNYLNFTTIKNFIESYEIKK